MDMYTVFLDLPIARIKKATGLLRCLFTSEVSISVELSTFLSALAVIAGRPVVRMADRFG